MRQYPSFFWSSTAVREKAEDGNIVIRETQLGAAMQWLAKHDGVEYIAIYLYRVLQL